MYAYIDESGDTATGGRGSRWLSVGCAILKDEEQKLQCESELASLSVALPGNKGGKPIPLHFSRIRQHKTRRGAYSGIARCGCQYMLLALSDTSQPMPFSRQRNKHYYFVVKEVIRRVLWLAEEWDKTPEICIDYREGTFKLDEFKRYLGKLRRSEDPRTNWKRLNLDKIRTSKPVADLCLGIADGVAHAGREAVEVDSWGHTELAYLTEIKSRLWHRRPKQVIQGGTPFPDGDWLRKNRRSALVGYGLILLPEDAQLDLRREHSWIADWDET